MPTASESRILQWFSGALGMRFQFLSSRIVTAAPLMPLRAVLRELPLHPARRVERPINRESL
ncbi:hypothetical protein [Cupriavidus sp. EM10]|uniref:hypothetical protein n=1 Tax=Cupriavidus sp. EM10 TaxID=2839983 RepID=UPI001C000AD6|nr:hypothetical protein [Cupriavidus sp. EM10]QWE94012.1 hypothetical protein KLP38_14180 [Cupriavidus sp. EM10]